MDPQVFLRKNSKTASISHRKILLSLSFLCFEIIFKQTMLYFFDQLEDNLQFRGINSIFRKAMVFFSLFSQNHKLRNIWRLSFSNIWSAAQQTSSDRSALRLKKSSWQQKKECDRSSWRRGSNLTEEAVERPTTFFLHVQLYQERLTRAIFPFLFEAAQALILTCASFAWRVQLESVITGTDWRRCDTEGWKGTSSSCDFRSFQLIDSSHVIPTFEWEISASNCEAGAILPPIRAVFVLSCIFCLWFSTTCSLHFCGWKSETSVTPPRAQSSPQKRQPSLRVVVVRQKIWWKFDSVLKERSKILVPKSFEQNWTTGSLPHWLVLFLRRNWPKFAQINNSLEACCTAQRDRPETFSKMNNELAVAKLWDSLCFRWCQRWVMASSARYLSSSSVEILQRKKSFGFSPSDNSFWSSRDTILCSQARASQKRTTREP